MKKRRRDRRFRPTLDPLSLRLAPSGVIPGGLTPMPPSPYLDPTGPTDMVVVAPPPSPNPGGHLEPVGPSTPC